MQAANDDGIGILRLPDGPVACRVMRLSAFGARLLVDARVAVAGEFELETAPGAGRRAGVAGRRGATLAAALGPPS